jgi:hypothetical protein
MTPTEAERYENMLRDQLSDLRHAIQDVANITKSTKDNRFLQLPSTADGPDKREVLANLTLAYRHLEDARMRLGKALQELDGGVSIYDKP